MMEGKEGLGWERWLSVLDDILMKSVKGVGGKLWEW